MGAEQTKELREEYRRKLGKRPFHGCSQEKLLQRTPQYEMFFLPKASRKYNSL